MTRVQLEKIAQTFGGQDVLRGLDLTVESGEYLVLLGKSGCGKTTTLRIIAGLQSPDEGNVLFDQRRVNQVAPHQRDVAMVFQQDGLYPHLTVGDSIRFALRGKVSSAEMESRVDEAAALTQIESILDRTPSRLSGGELRRCAVAKAIARRCRVRLLDEPLSALDVPVRYALQDDILRWHATVAGTTIHVTHDGQEAMRMADRIAVMDAGRIVQLATPRDVYAKPQTVSVAQAIGSPPINLFAARVVGGALEFGNPNVRCGVALDSTSDREVIVGVRPEAFRLRSAIQPPQAEPLGVIISGRRIRSQCVQSETHVGIESGDDFVSAVFASASDDVLGQGEQTMTLSCVESDVHLFDVQSGVRLETGFDR